MLPAGLIDEFDAGVRRCSSLAELAALIAEVTRALGFDHFALLHHARLGAGGSGAAPAGGTAGGVAGGARGGAGLIRLDSYPAAWVEELSAKSLASHDPVHLASGRTNLGFSWEQLGTLVAVTGRHREILERSRRHGIGAGFTVPANVPGEPAGSCSFAMRRGRALPKRHLHCAELIGAHAFGAARRLHGLPETGARPRLSRREQECLCLVAAGKSDWEIGRILGIAEATARQYVKRARAAYDVATRTQLVVHGLRDAWISFGDAIPPNGGMG